MRDECAKFLRKNSREDADEDADDYIEWKKMMDNLVKQIAIDPDSLREVISISNMLELVSQVHEEEERRRIVAEGYAAYMEVEENWATDVDVSILAFVSKIKICVYQKFPKNGNAIRYDRFLTAYDTGPLEAPVFLVLWTDYTQPGDDTMRAHFEGLQVEESVQFAEDAVPMAD
jgi:hypothetical protein